MRLPQPKYVHTCACCTISFVVPGGELGKAAEKTNVVLYNGKLQVVCVVLNIINTSTYLLKVWNYKDGNSPSLQINTDDRALQFICPSFCFLFLLDTLTESARHRLTRKALLHSLYSTVRAVFHLLFREGKRGSLQLPLECTYGLIGGEKGARGVEGQSAHGLLSHTFKRGWL